MKKGIVLFLLTVALTMSIQAQVHLDVAPYLWMDSKGNASADYAPSLQELYDWYERPAMANLSLDLENEMLKLYMQIEVRSDLMADLHNLTFSNLQIYQNGGIYFDPNYPDTGYAEFNSDFLTFSIGRRKLDWGPGYYGLGLSDIEPYFDHIWFDASYPDKSGEWKYTFVLVTTDRRATGSDKTFIAHSFAYSWPNLIITAMDYNLIYNRGPDLQELAPLIHFHGLYQSDQNVALGLAADWKVNPDLRLYSELFIDDFQISIESGDSNPGGMGLILGSQFLIKEGSPVKNVLNRAEDHTLESEDFSFKGGIYLRLEHLWASQYLYNREEVAGEFTSPLYYMWEYTPKIVNSYFGAAYGPDRTIERITLTYDKEPVKGELLFEYHRIGSFGIDGLYAAPFANWITLGNPVINQFRIALGGMWNYKEDRSLFGDLKIDFGEDFRIQGGIGWGLRLF